MSESVIAFFAVSGIIVSVSVLCHWLIRNYIVASLCAAVIADIGVHLAAYLEVGYLDPLFPISLVTAGIISLFVAMIVGFLFLAIRHKRKGHHAA